MATIAELTYYPIKGCAGTSPAEMELTGLGPRHDRAFMVVDPDGDHRTQRGSPHLATIRPDISADGRSLTLRAPGIQPLDLTPRTDGERRQVLLFGRTYPAVDQGEEAAEWMTAALRKPSRLVRVPDDHQRTTSGETPGSAAFADGHAVLVTSRASLEDLNGRITAAGGEPVPMERFRPNIVVEGWPRPHTEDRVRSMTLGRARLGYAKLDIRCVVTTVDQRTGVKAGPEPLRTLARYRRSSQGGVAFGMKAAVVGTGRVTVGDEVRVDTWAAPQL
ncbi:hypothetical protein FHX37_3238 [Haloactinospora alba]|uniref:MOSC domain-containing protein n=1 Tax=Haloactinospora alba TaxID=405555 RepID=A0A543NN38_9ACTN|nr:MOSC N-terminal beta barrel domain-containing protein [Haloactinospora alba]TQN33233.1 hypothetical protein FHX37_3238 [Haloactinospora alba]